MVSRMISKASFAAGLAAASIVFPIGVYASEPVILTDKQLDRISAGGVALNLLSQALATGGSISIAETGGGAASGTTSDPSGAFQSSGVVLGTAAAFAPGGSSSTGVSTSGASPGAPGINVSAGGTVTGAVGQVSVGFTYTSGGAAFIP
jgi:hypothetical protein